VFRPSCLSACSCVLINVAELTHLDNALSCQAREACLIHHRSMLPKKGEVCGGGGGRGGGELPIKTVFLESWHQNTTTMLWQRFAPVGACVAAASTSGIHTLCEELIDGKPVSDMELKLVQVVFRYMITFDTMSKLQICVK